MVKSVRPKHKFDFTYLSRKYGLTKKGAAKRKVAH